MKVKYKKMTNKETKKPLHVVNVYLLLPSSLTGSYVTPSSNDQCHFEVHC